MSSPPDIVLVPVPGGPFLRGSPPGVGMEDERPQRTVTVSEFEIGATAVTFEQFTRFVDAGGYADRALWSEPGWLAREREGWLRPRFFGEPEWGHVTGATQPVCGVSFYEAEAFARFCGMRLPTEAEWEKAARGTDGRLYPWGETWQEGRCSFRGGQGRAAPPVGGFPLGASPYGALDMAGGVWEWCADWYDPGYYRAAPERDPPGPAETGRKAARGGAWNAVPLLNRTANRNAWRPTARFSNLGFRLAR